MACIEVMNLHLGGLLGSAILRFLRGAHVQTLYPGNDSILTACLPCVLTAYEGKMICSASFMVDVCRARYALFLIRICGLSPDGRDCLSLAGSCLDLEVASRAHGLDDVGCP